MLGVSFSQKCMRKSVFGIGGEALEFNGDERGEEELPNEDTLAARAELGNSIGNKKGSDDGSFGAYNTEVGETENEKVCS
ncbi:hypothetical protein L3X38_028849 [Prunus dulcis]|uniref:Uncharacterized protein n=1 Tax=Prunus dulcis TaxID=3755 RepID=A0AAD4Z0T9_PRUDU|nr:hypothetical protein L3X38_028849 [Prunus dulcis]